MLEIQGIPFKLKDDTLQLQIDLYDMICYIQDPASHPDCRELLKARKTEYENEIKRLRELDMPDLIKDEREMYEVDCIVIKRDFAVKYSNDRKNLRTIVSGFLEGDFDKVDFEKMLLTEFKGLCDKAVKEYEEREKKKVSSLQDIKTNLNDTSTG